LWQATIDLLGLGSTLIYYCILFSPM